MDSNTRQYQMQSNDMRTFARMNMHEQITAIDSNRSNVIEMYEESYNSIKRDIDGDDEALAILNQDRDSFYEETYNTISRRFNIVIDIDNIETEAFNGLVKVIYDIFIYDYRNTIIDFISRYIIRNKKSIYSQIPTELKSKDIIISACKNICADNRDAVIVANTSYIIERFILGNDMDVEYFTNILCNDNINNTVFERYFSRGTVDLLPTFYSAFIEPLRRGEVSGIDIMVNNTLVQSFPRRGSFDITVEEIDYNE